MLKNILLRLIEIYRRWISPMMAPRCRYYPTCSAYSRQAIIWHGAAKGLGLSVRRISRCYPWGGSGIDFVPLPLARYHYQPSRICFSYVFKDVLSYRVRLNHLMKIT
ncbi:membrane protein insertion efficiency factor YidD [Moraxella canis]|uniref:membrane protein insertion efficiency factor YidD n=1 Tax=Moraxella canis TaxID=90239 RepID=UPI0006669593|nr:membrane protein insertion efficiency factor YidD [Moraxella canis]